MYLKILKQIIMRFTLIVTLFSVAVSMVTAEDTKSQTKKETNIELSLSDASVVSVIETIVKETGCKFLYNEEQLLNLKRINIELRHATIQQVLQQVANQTGLEFHKMDDNSYIVVLPKEQAKSEVKVQPGIRITGTVSNNNDELLPGVTVAIRGTTTGTSTDFNGEFSITVPSDTSVLQFTFIGYRMQEVVVGNRRIIAVTMQATSTELGEVVVVGFGVQKKESVVGSVTSVNIKDLKMPTSNLTTTLAGNMAGVIAYQRSGEPGQDNADFFVRGITTFGTNTNPLILIDGIELTSADLARLRPDDIESFSILKDATATALYGARGANGVILVTTKQGKVGPAKISFRFENSVSKPTRNIEVADPVTYMKLHNEAVMTRDPKGAVPYTQEKIGMTEEGRYPLIYPANDWKEMLFKDHTMNQRANLSVSGGIGGGAVAARYYVSGSYNRDNGIMKVDKRNNFNNNIAINNYNLRANVNIDITKTTEMIVRLSGNFEDYNGPIPGGTQMYDYIVHSNPVLFPAYFDADEKYKYTEHILFGNYYGREGGGKTNPYAEMVRGYKERSRSQMLAQLELKQNLKFITEGLSVRGMLNISRLSQFAVIRAYTPFYYQISTYNRQTGEYRLNETRTGTEYLGWSDVPGERLQNSTFYFEGQANYTRDFGKHSVSGLLVYQARQSLDANASSLQLSLPS